DIFTTRVRGNVDREIAAACGKPCRTASADRGCPCSFNVCILLRFRLNNDLVADLHLERRDIHLSAVNGDVAVVHKLACLTARGRKARAIDNIVQATLKQEKKVFARNPLLAKSLFEICTKLFFENEVNALHLLLLTKLFAIARKHLASGPAVLSRRIGSAFFDRTRRLEAAIALKKKFCTFAAAKPAHRISISSHNLPPAILAA